MSSISFAFESIADTKLFNIELDKEFFKLNGKTSWLTFECPIPEKENSSKKKDKNTIYKIDKYFII
jgi:hypothetical protein